MEQKSFTQIYDELQDAIWREIQEAENAIGTRAAKYGEHNADKGWNDRGIDHYVLTYHSPFFEGRPITLLAVRKEETIGETWIVARKISEKSKRPLVADDITKRSVFTIADEIINIFQ